MRFLFVFTVLIVVSLMVAPRVTAEEPAEVEQDNLAPVLGQSDEVPAAPEKEESALCTPAVVEGEMTAAGEGPGSGGSICFNRCEILGQVRYIQSTTCCCHTQRLQELIETCRQVTSTCRRWAYSGVSCSIGVFCETNQCL